MSAAAQTASPPSTGAPGAKADPKTEATAAKRRWTARRYMGVGVLVTLFLFFGVGVWSATAMISGAVISQFAELRVESKRKVVQHLEGGVVADIPVKNGDHVTAGEVVMSLDRTAMAANVAIIDGQLDELLARSARLEAEARNLEEMTADDYTAERAARRPRAAEMLEGQRELFVARLHTLRQQTEQLKGRIEQIGDQIEGSEAQIRALDRQLELIAEELEDARALLAKGLIQKARVVALERDEARLAGDRGAQLSQVAQLKGRISELNLRSLELRSNRREEAISELRDVASQIAELRERRTSLAESLDRMEIRAPDDGVIHELAINTVGGVVTPATPIMYIVPVDEKLIVEARIETASRDQVNVLQEAYIVFPGFNQRTTPQINGIVSKISADRQFDEQSQVPYYLVEVTIPEDQLQVLTEAIGSELAPGMPAEVHIQTGDRTAASYFIRPLLDNFNRSLREE